MPPVPESKLTEIREAVPCVRYIESMGFPVKQSGNDFLCSCPLNGHEDTNPSFRMTGPLYNCLSRCGGGNVFQLVQKIEHCDFLAAVEKLAALGGIDFTVSTYRGQGRPKPIPKDCPLEAHGTNEELANQAIDFYQSQLLQRGNAGWEYLEKRGLACKDMISRFRLGFAKRGELGTKMPKKNTVAGAAIRDQLQSIGLYNVSGHEYFAGSVVVPVFHGDTLMDCYGRKVTRNLRAGTPQHLYLPTKARPHETTRGVWNLAGIEQSPEKTLILCESLLDALSCYINGYHHVTCTYGTSCFPDELQAAILAAGIHEVYIAYDNDDSGNAAAEKVAKILIAEGLTAYRIQVPSGLNDINALCVEAGKNSKQAVCDLIAGAQWIGGKPKIFVVVDDLDEANDNDQETQATPSENPQKTLHKSTLTITESGEDLFADIGSRMYRIRHFDKNPVAGILKIQLRVMVNDDYFQENIELCSSKSRRQFAKQASVELGLRDEVFYTDSKKLLRACEDRQDAALAAVAAGHAAANDQPAMTNNEKAAALAALKDPDLIAHIGGDLDKAGLIGEEISRLVCYLAATSRLLPDPLGIVIQSSSAAGKSSVMNNVLSLMPDDSKKTFISMSKQSLLYLEENALEHKILGVAELAGAQEISYYLKMLLSEKHLSMASVNQDPTTGEMRTREYHVNGPTALILTTTEEDEDMDGELLNRCLILSVTETPEQTNAIFQRQRQRRTHEGASSGAERTAIINKHHNMQRLLRPLRVINNYAPQLTFVDSETRHRRDHEKYLNVIDAIALLHQYQRPIKKHPQGFDFVEVTPEDITIANYLAAVVLGRSLARLTPKTKEFLHILDNFVAARAQRDDLKRDAVEFTRRHIREHCEWSDPLLKRHLRRLVDQELLSVHQGIGPHAWTYTLHYTCTKNASECAVLNLIDVSALENPETYDYDAQRIHFSDKRIQTGYTADTPWIQGGYTDEIDETPVKHSANAKNQEIA